MSRIPLAAAAAMLCLAPACGKKGPPLPPLRSYPEQVAGLRIRQIGEQILLSFPRPTSRTDGTALGPDAGIEIQMTAREPAPKRAQEIKQEPAATVRIPASEWDLHGQGKRLDVGLSLDRIARELKVPDRVLAMKGKKLSFMVEVVEGKRKRSDPSEIETFAVCDVPPAPAGAAARILEGGILLTWSGTGPFRVYRQEEGSPRPEAPLNQEPLASSSYLDAGAALGKPYLYVVRKVAEGTRCESADSAIVAATRVDSFPPAPPQGLAAVAEQGTIRLFWRPNKEPDLRGYRVYRVDGSEGAMRLLTPEDLTTTSYTDKDVVTGVVYSYSVTARDGATPPNESPFSDPAMERLETAN